MKNYIQEQMKMMIHNCPIKFLDDKALENKEFFLKVFDAISYVLKKELFINIDGIFIGNNKYLSDHDFDSAFKDGCIYLNANFKEPLAFYEALTHEIGHALEENYASFLYGDDLIISEYSEKLQKVKEILKERGYSNIPEETDEFDEFLYEVVGYDELTDYTSDIFISPYAVTSYREYFATGFEEFGLRYDPSVSPLKIISPFLFNKIEELMENL